MEAATKMTVHLDVKERVEVAMRFLDRLNDENLSPRRRRKVLRRYLKYLKRSGRE